MAVSLVHPARFTGPCGCTACEKWSDCAYCGTCSPEPQDPGTPRRIRDLDMSDVYADAARMEDSPAAFGYIDCTDEYGRYELDYDDPRNMDLYDGD